MNDDKLTITVFLNGNIHTVNKKMPNAEAMAIQSGKIIAIGSNEEVLKKVSSINISEIDLKGKFVLPGFVDSHAHPAMTSVEVLYEVDLFGETSKEGYLEKVKDFYEKNKDVKIIKGSGWANAILSDSPPQKEDLDKISKEIPILLSSDDHHTCWGNSKAFELAEINKDTTVKGGQIAKNSKTGEPIGTVNEEALKLFASIIGEYSVEEYEEAWLEYQRIMASYGITMTHDARIELNNNSHKAAYNLVKSDKFLFKIAASAYVPVNNTAYIDKIIETGRNYDGKNFFTNHAKFFIDGVVEAKTAWLKEPYEGESSYRGEGLWDDEILFEALKKLDDAGWWAHFHCIGDAAAEQIINALSRVEQINGIKNRRNILAHGQIIDKKDIDQMVKLNLTVSANPYWFIKNEYSYKQIEERNLGEERASKEYLMKSLMDAGIVVASASDFNVTPIPNPLIGIMTGAIRCLPEEINDEDKRLGVEECVTVENMIKSFTINGAYTIGKDESTGSLEEGKDADFIILDKNILTIPVVEIGSTKVLETYSEGKRIYKLKKENS